MSYQKILILDFGSQVTQLIARRLREAHVYCEVYACDVSDAWLRAYAADGLLKGIILSGSHASVFSENTDTAPQVIFELGLPVLGICYGMQTMAQQLGGQIAAEQQREFGYAEIRAHGHTALLDGIADYTSAEGHGMLKVWMSHGDQVVQLPPGFQRMASTPDCPFAGMADETRRFYGVQFHPEFTHTPQGAAILQRFACTICGVRANWVMQDYAAEAIEMLRKQVGTEQVLLGLSGGVDSSVAAALIHRAIGDQLTCVFVDNGLLRLNEGNMVMGLFAEQLHAKVVRVDASARFMDALAGIVDPEAKRKIIGRLFVDVFMAEAEKCKIANNQKPGVTFLAQGTIYPDVIESGASKSNKAATIKSHHNVGGLPEYLNLKLLEPLRNLFKDEVRALGLALGLPQKMVYRHPFPGPGLGVRILGEVKREYADILRQTDAIFIDTLQSTVDTNSGKTWYEQTSQAFAVFLPVKSVGVMGDGRTYEYTVALRAIQTTDFMTANWAELPHSLLRKVANRIVNEVKGVNRVTYDISSKPPATIEWE